MPYLIFIANGEEYDRRDLRGPMLLGRAPDCDLSIPDITLSRRHCRVEPSENGRGWQLIDLHSKNGTQFRGQNIQCHVFRDGDELRIGRTRVTFKAGKFAKGSSSASARTVLRAVDPHEALSGTVSGMVVCEPGETERHPGMPIPQPRPIASPAEVSENAQAADQVALSPSGSDAPPARPRRAAPVPGVTQAPSGQPSAPDEHHGQHPYRAHAAPQSAHGRPRVSFELQADHAEPETRPAAGLLETSAPRRPSPLLVGASSAAALAAVLFLAAWISVSSSRRHAQPPASASPASPDSTVAPPAPSDDLAIAASAHAAAAPSVAVSAATVDLSADDHPSANGRIAAVAPKVDPPRRAASKLHPILPPTHSSLPESTIPLDLDFVSAPAHSAHPVDIVPDDLLNPIGRSHDSHPQSAR